MSGMVGTRAGTQAPLESSFPGGAVPLASILLTDELRRRPSRAPEYEKENSALVSLVSALADSPRTILQTLADKALEVLQAGSAGLSLLTKDETRFFWAAIAGAWGPHIGGGTPRSFGPCGGLSNKEIAGALGRTEATIKVHVLHIFQKLNATDRTEAVTTALQRGLIHLR